MAKRSEYGAYRNPMAHGYIRIYCPGHPLAAKDGYALEHRKVAYDAGLLTDLKLIVHHINGNRADNRLENLKVKTQGTHMREHAAEAGEVTNQFGVFPVVLAAAERAERSRRYQRDRAARLRALGAPCRVCGAPCAPGNAHCSRSCGSIGNRNAAGRK